MTAQALVTLIVGVIGFSGVIASLFQRTWADRRAEWWRRATWAADHVLSGRAQEQLVGIDVLFAIQRSRLASREDRRMFAHWMEAFSVPNDISGWNWKNGGGRTP